MCRGANGAERGERAGRGGAGGGAGWARHRVPHGAGQPQADPAKSSGGETVLSLALADSMHQRLLPVFLLENKLWHLETNSYLF